MMKIKTLILLLVIPFFFSTASVADTVDIREWLIPWKKSEATDTFVDSHGRIWFVAFDGSYIANFSPGSEEFNRYDLRRGTAPSAVLIDDNGLIWYASNKRRHIGSLNPATGRVTELEMPDRKAKGLRSLAFDQSGDIWFTSEDGHFVGRLRISTSEIDLIPIPTKNSRPFGITMNSAHEPWVAASGRNALIHVNPLTMAITEIETPNGDSRPRRLVTTSDDRVWYADYELGLLGGYDPQSGEFREWPMPGGAESRPFGMAVDRNDRIWIVETGRIPNRLIGFDAGAETFLTETDIPSGAGSVGHLHYSEDSGEVWFATATNYIGRAKVH